MTNFKKELTDSEINELNGFDQWRYYLLRAFNLFVKKKSSFDKPENLPPPIEQLYSLVEKTASHPKTKSDGALFVKQLLEMERMKSAVSNNCFAMASSVLLFLPLIKAGVPWSTKWEKLMVLDDTNTEMLRTMVQALPLDRRSEVLWRLNLKLSVQLLFVDLIPSARMVVKILQAIDIARLNKKEISESSISLEKKLYELRAKNSAIEEGIKQFETEKAVSYLHREVRLGNEEQVRAWLDKGVDPSTPLITNKNTALHAITEKTSTAIIELLLERGCDLESLNVEEHLWGATGYTPLIFLLKKFPRHSEETDAACQHAFTLVKLLLQKGANLDWYQDRASTFASHTQFDELNEYLESLKYYNSSLVEALQDNDLQTYKSLINSTMPLSAHANDVMQGIMDDDVDDQLAVEIATECLPFITDINHPCSQPRNSFLMLATHAKNLKLMELLIDHGADIDYINRDGRSALLVAVIYNKLEEARLLIARGASITGERGAEYLMSAIDNKNIAMMQLLLTAGVDVNVIVNDKTPLQAAMETKNAKVINTLLSAKANPNIKGSGADYPLLMAIKCDLEIFHQLLLHGADLSIKDGKKTIAAIAQASKKPGVAELCALTFTELQNYKPKNEGLIFTNKRMLFALGVDHWTDTIKAQVKKVFGKMSIDTIKIEVGEMDIEYVDVIDADSQKGVYQLMTFNYGDGALLAWNKTTLVGNICQHGFEVAKAMNDDVKSQLHSMLEQANQAYGSVAQSVEFAE